MLYNRVGLSVLFRHQTFAHGVKFACVFHDVLFEMLQGKLGRITAR
jgi:hypothetical protein